MKMEQVASDVALGFNEEGNAVTIMHLNKFLDSDKHEYKGTRAKKEELKECLVNFARDFDGKSIWEAMASRPDWKYASMVRWIEFEGGYVDENGIVHKNK